MSIGARHRISRTGARASKEAKRSEGGKREKDEGKRTLRLSRAHIRAPRTERQLQLRAATRPPPFASLRIPFYRFAPRRYISSLLSFSLRPVPLFSLYFCPPCSHRPRPKYRRSLGLSSSSGRRRHTRAPPPPQGRASERTTGLVTCTSQVSQRSYGHRRHLA